MSNQNKEAREDTADTLLPSYEAAINSPNTGNFRIFVNNIHTGVVPVWSTKIIIKSFFIEIQEIYVYD